MCDTIPEKRCAEVEKSFPDGFPGRVALPESSHKFLFQLPEQLGDEDVLVLEIAIDRSGAHARFFGDIGHRGAMKTLFRHEFQGRLHDVSTLV